jgi:subtilisin family serine protease
MLRRFVAIALFALASLFIGAAQGASPEVGNYIVVLKNVSDPAAVATKHKQKYGAEVVFVYKHALKGYTAKLSATALASVAADPDVLSVSEDGLVQAFQEQPPQRVSNAVLRIDGDESSTRSGDGRGAVNVNVAVLDDGMDASHPELNVVGSTSCVNGRRNDPRGFPSGWHGTAVGGYLAALDNAIGVVGVAPGARLWAVKVLGDNGFGTNSEVICGLDWVAATRVDSDPGNDIVVVNMSLGGPAGLDSGRCPASHNDAFHLAVCNVVAAGVSIVAAAGNEGTDFEQHAPATYDDVLTVTAMGDRDGQPGGLGGQFMCDPLSFDDEAAYWSNFATPKDQAHTVAAPGVCNVSLFPGGQYGVGSGTSFSTPLVAGTVALCIAAGPCKRLTPTQIVQKIVADAAAYNTSRKGSGYGFVGDPLSPISGKYYGYLVRAGLY